jgi:hypothetical protein
MPALAWKESVLKTAFIALPLSLQLVGCAPVPVYERAFLNDPDMQTGPDPGQKQAAYVRSIREGSTPAGSSKSGGGCGCN